MISKSFLKHSLIGILTAIVAYDFVRIPFTNDVGIFMGVAHIADKFYPFPQGLDLAWEAKPIGNRILNYIVLKFAQLFYPFEDHSGFSLAAKVFALLMVIAVAAYFAYVIRGEYTFWIVLLAFLTPINFCVMQAEWYAALFAILSIAMIVSRNKYALFLAGMFLIFIGMIKGITALLFIPILCGAYLLGKLEQKAIVTVLAGCLAMTVLVIIAQFTIWPNMLPDLLLAPYITGVGRLPFIDCLQVFIIQSIATVYYIPVLIAGVIGAMLLLISKKVENIWAFLLMWGTCIGIVVIHSEYFAYHFFIYVIPAIVTIMLCLRVLDAKA